MNPNSKSENRKKNVRLFKTFLPYLSRHKGEIALDLFCASLTTVCELVLPLIVRRITDGAAGADPGAVLTPLAKEILGGTQ